jgi:preprotein translocase subunit YajC
MMPKHVAAAALGVTLLVAIAGTALAADMVGTVSRVDTATRTIYLSDGRTVRIDPGATVSVDGRTMPFDAIQPGSSIVVREGSVAVQAAPGRSQVVVQQPTSGQAPAAAPPAAVVQPPGAVQAPGVLQPSPLPSVQSPAIAQSPRVQSPGVSSEQPVLTPHPPINASGIVASVDRQNQTITFRDGRTVRLSDRAAIWQPTTIGMVHPGEQVFVRGVEPVSFNQQGMERMRLGTVSRVDQASNVIELNDGTIVRTSPGTRLRLDDRQVTISQLRPGQEIVIRTPNRAPAFDQSGNASPREDSMRAAIDAEEIQIMPQPQAP